MATPTEAQRTALRRLSDAWLQLAGGALALHGYEVSEDALTARALPNGTTLPIAQAVEQLRKRIATGGYPHLTTRALDGLDDLIVSARGWRSYVDTATGEHLVRADNGDAYTSPFAVECICEEVADWNEPGGALSGEG